MFTHFCQYFLSNQWFLVFATALGAPQFWTRSRSTLLAKNWSRAPIFAPPIEKECAPAPATEKLECAPISAPFSIYTILKVQSLRKGLQLRFCFVV